MKTMMKQTGPSESVIEKFMSENDLHRYTFRLQISDTGSVHVFDFNEHRATVVPSVSDLPEWLQGRIAVLSVLKEDDTDLVAGIGRRHEPNVFWIDGDENNGEDT